VLDGGRVAGVADIEPVAFEVAEAEYDMGELADGEAVEGGASAGIVADDGGAGRTIKVDAGSSC